MKFNLKLAGQYSNNLSTLINKLSIDPYRDQSNLFTIKENHQKSKIKVGKENLDFEDEEIIKEKTGEFKDISLQDRLDLIKDLATERLKINTIIAQKSSEARIKSVFTGEEISVDLAKQENVFMKNTVYPQFDHVSSLQDSKTQGYEMQEVAAGDGISNVKYPVEITKILDIDRKFVEDNKMDILKKIDEQSMEIDKVKTNSEFEFDNKFDIRATVNSLILNIKQQG